MITEFFESGNWLSIHFNALKYNTVVAASHIKMSFEKRHQRVHKCDKIWETVYPLIVPWYHFSGLHMFMSLNNIFAHISLLNQENLVDALVGRLPSLHAWKKKHEIVAREWWSMKRWRSLTHSSAQGWETSNKGTYRILLHHETDAHIHRRHSTCCITKSKGAISASEWAISRSPPLRTHECWVITTHA